MPLPEPKLQEWQAAVQESILSPGRALKSVMMGWLKHGDAISDLRLGIYIDAYVLRLSEALRTNYPALHQLLGDEDFDRMACRYLDVHPPLHSSIRWFGLNLADFLATETPYANIPSIAELAAFEWALRHTIDAADCDVLTLESLQAIDAKSWPQLTFALHPSLSVLSFQWNAPQIWNALTQNQKPPEPVQQANHWLVFRQPDLVSGWRSATALEIAALDSIRSGLSFADLCEVLNHLIDDTDSIPLTAVSFLKSWVEHGLLSRRYSTQ